MERLTGLDACFAGLDVAAPMAVTMVCTFDQGTATEPYAFERVRQTVADRLHLVPPMRRRLLEPVAGVGRPCWIDDPAFDLDRHLYRRALPDPGGYPALASLTSDLLPRPFDRDAPLWDMTVAEGFGPDQTASVTRLHHAAIDGVSGAEALANFLDLTADPSPTEPPEWRPAPLPRRAALIADSVRLATGTPAATARRLGRIGAAGWRLLGHARATGTRLLPFPAPRTPLNGPITDRRDIAFAQVGLSDLDRIRRRVGASINDTLLALCTGSLRRYLQRRTATPPTPLIAAVPVSARGDTASTAANQVSGMLVELPTDTDDPLEQLQRSVTAARAAKAQHVALGPHTVSELAELAPALLLRSLGGLEQRLGWSRWMPPAINVIISNFPGPPVPLYFAGARLQAAYPFGPIAFGTALNITAQSYLDTLHIGLNACPDVIEDVTEIANGLTDSLKDLLDASAAPR